MPPKFPSPEWVTSLGEKINSDEHYHRIASKWEDDILVVITPSGPLKETLYYYFDLWHGTCRKAIALSGVEGIKPAFTLTATYDNVVKIVTKQLDPIAAMMIRKLQVHGPMAVMMRNVPTVLDFVRCCTENIDEIM